MVFTKRLTVSDKIPIGKKKKIAFVCSGGAAKAGAFHLGVALALKEYGFHFLGGQNDDKIGTAKNFHQNKKMEISCYVGSSAGAIVSTYLTAGYSLDNIFSSFLSKRAHENLPDQEKIPKLLPRLTYAKLFKLRAELAREQLGQFQVIRGIITHLLQGNVEALLQLRWLKMTGFFSTSGIEQHIRKEVLPSNQFQDYVADLFIVASQLNHSIKTVFGKYKMCPSVPDDSCEYENQVEISEACAASTALPLIYAPYPIKNSKNENIHYIDGEIRDTLSTHVAVDAGADLVIASYTHQPYHTAFEESSLTNHGLPSILIQSIYLLVERKIKLHIQHKENQKRAILDVLKYCKENGVPERHQKKICELMERDLQQRLDVDTIYIHPDPHDSQVFFREHFSLSPRKMSEVVKSGFKAAIKTLGKYEFADRDKEIPIGTPRVRVEK